MLPTKQLDELIRRKHEILTQLRDVGQRQTNLVVEGDINSVLTLLAAKQQLISSLQTVEKELTPYYAEEPEQRVWASPDDRTACAKRVVECNALLEDIVRLEKFGADKITDRRNEVAKKLENVHSATQVRNAYEAHRANRAS